VTKPSRAAAGACVSGVMLFLLSLGLGQPLGGTTAGAAGTAPQSIPPDNPRLTVATSSIAS
jgi:hypothetical protein